MLWVNGIKRLAPTGNANVKFCNRKERITRRSPPAKLANDWCQRAADVSSADPFQNCQQDAGSTLRRWDHDPFLDKTVLHIQQKPLLWFMGRETNSPESTGRYDLRL
jgi:hypothetical protein